MENDSYVFHWAYDITHRLDHGYFPLHYYQWCDGGTVGFGVYPVDAGELGKVACCMAQPQDVSRRNGSEGTKLSGGRSDDGLLAAMNGKPASSCRGHMDHRGNCG